MIAPRWTHPFLVAFFFGTGAVAQSPTPVPTDSLDTFLTETSETWNYRKWTTRDWKQPRSGSYLYSAYHTTEPWEGAEDLRHQQANPLRRCGKRMRLSFPAARALLDFSICMEIMGFFALIIVIISYSKQLEREPELPHKAQVLLCCCALIFHCIAWGCWCGYAGQVSAGLIVHSV